MVDGEQVTIAFHVDDLLITSKNELSIKKVVTELEKEFEGVTVNTGRNQSYLGMNLDMSDEYYSADMKGYIEKIVKDHGCEKESMYPATLDLMKDDENSKSLNEEEQKLFHSQTAKVLFIAKRTKLAILTAVSVLASKVNKATEEDKSRLNKIFAYLNYTKDELVKFKCDVDVNLQAYVDASWAVHKDCKSRTGVVLMMSGAAVGGWSYKQKIVTKHSTEAEIVGLTDGLSEVVWGKRWLMKQGYNLNRVKVYQDNDAVIKLMRSDRRTHQRTKHLDVRYFYARELQQDGEIEVTWTPTGEMIADVMTKALQGKTFIYLSNLLTGNG